MTKPTLIAFIAMACCADACANLIQVMTFTSDPAAFESGFEGPNCRIYVPMQETFCEDGIFLDNPAGSFYSDEGSLHFDIFNDGAGARIANFWTGSVFNVLSLELFGASTSHPNLYPYVGFSGYLHDSLVASVALYRSAGSGNETMQFGSLFNGIDRFQVAVLPPASCEDFSSCSTHFSIDNLTLASVPEPSAIWLLSTGLLPFTVRRLTASRAKHR